MGFKKKNLSDNSGYWFEAKKDKLLVYIAEPDRNLWMVEVRTQHEGTILKEFHTLTQFISSFNKAKLVF